eukprot:m.36267 g.36267  ORF g.36267 m.36267 type:complete len:294 (-) comp11395_c0_seq1:149-1030(-)
MARQNDAFPIRFALSAAAAAVAETVTFPLDITKTRMQLARVDGGRPSMVRTMIGIVRDEGLLKLWRGLSPAVLRHVVYSGSRLGIYEQLRERVFHKSADGRFPLWKAVAAGMTSGAIGQLFASPTDLVKIRMQMEGRRILEGKPPRYSGVANAFATIYRQEGLRGLWKGAVPNMQRAALVNLGDLTTYDTVKHILLTKTQLGDQPLTHAMSSVCAGFVAASLGAPADIVKSRMMNQGELYTSSWDCLRKTVAETGFTSLWRGFVPCWMRMAPWSLTFWLSYEQIRRVTGVASF